MNIIWFLPLGFFIGILSGFFGIGGGIILTPLLLILGFQPSVAIATSLMLTLGSTISSSISHSKNKNVKWKASFTIGIAGIVGSQVAVPLVLYLEGNSAADIVISISYILLLGYFAYGFLFKKEKKNMRASINQNQFFTLVLIGLFAGFISSLMGVSGGFIITPLLVSAAGYDLKKAVGTSVAAAFLIVFSGIVNYSLNSDVNYILGILLIVGAFMGAPVGANLLNGFENATVKKYLGWFYIAIAVSVIFEQMKLKEVSLIILLSVTVGFLGILARRVFVDRKQQKKEQMRHAG
ncbi:sulfite exporter TauE/SafE family protein [Bacillus sp. 165]|uniref:sulfite exporter TauE/SafE family protein n=1 Tax=Bacillus sp. 165 TaxID=1529117 RepID=UPI001ADD1F9D|nr:sulfite exporter TauE/SafE family protein [Bacillus sp. 165]MBO9129647.1 sulfite exporter TauE/SafE family protein [Bacillus sp. 165]